MISLSNMPEISEALAKKIEILKAHLPEMKKKFHVKEIGVFGSYVHGDQTKKSDIDILVEYEKVTDLFEFMALENHLSELLKMKVDLVPKDGIKKIIKKSILENTIYV